MAGRSRGSDQGEDTVVGVSERSLFVTPLPASLQPSFLVPSPSNQPLQAGTPAQGRSSADRIVRVRRQLGRLSLPRLRGSVAAAAELELDRGIAFLLVPVCLAVGAIVTFRWQQSLTSPKPVAVVVLTGFYGDCLALLAEDASVPDGGAAVRAWLARCKGRDVAHRNPMLGSEIFHATDRPRRFKSSRWRLPHPLTIDVTSTARRNCAMRRKGSGFRPEISGGNDCRLPGHRLRQTVAADRSGAAGQFTISPSTAISPALAAAASFSAIQQSSPPMTVRCRCRPAFPPG